MPAYSNRNMGSEAVSHGVGQGGKVNQQGYGLLWLA